jgi:hypothetical protein
MLRAKSFTINVVADVAGFPEQCIKRLTTEGYRLKMAIFIQLPGRRKTIRRRRSGYGGLTKPVTCYWSVTSGVTG